MRMTTHTHTPTARRVGVATACSVLALGLLVLGAGPASADEGETPTSLQLLEQCGESTDYCEFHPSGQATTAWSDEVLVATTANCTGTSQYASQGWSRTVSSSNSVGVSLKVLVGASKAFMNGFKIAYQHTWTESTTDAETTKIEVPAGHIGRIYHARETETVTGTYELHFGDRYYDHYYWYVPMTVTSPKTDGNDRVVTRTTPMTADEIASFCG